MDLKAESSNNQGSLQNQSHGQISHLAIDIGGSLIKLVYFSRSSDGSRDDDTNTPSKDRISISNGDSNVPLFEGRLRFAKFETSKIDDCIEFIRSKQLHLNGCWHHDSTLREKTIIK
ncbi:hypothetical protein CRG98_036959, partial [Punica granatum]